MRVKLIAAASLLACLAGCFGGGAPGQLLDPHRRRGRGRPRSRAPPARARRSPSSSRPCPQALGTTRVPVYVSDTVVQYLKDAEWVEEPGGPVRPAGRRDDLGADRPGGARSQPVQPRSRHPPHRPAAPLRPRSEQRWRWSSSTTPRSRAAPMAASPPTASKRASRSPEATAAAVAPALNQAANQVAAQVAAWVGAVKPSPGSFEACSNTSLERPGVGARSARARRASSRPRASPKRRQRPSGGTSFAPRSAG